VTGSLLVLDYGTATSVAVLRTPDGATRPLDIDGLHHLPSAVRLDADGTPRAGHQAIAGESDTARLARYPKQHLDAAHIRLGDRDVPVTDLVAATLRRFADRAAEVLDGPVDRLVLTVPSAWTPRRLGVLRDAALAAGLPEPATIPRAVAVAMYFSAVLEHPVEEGANVVTYHLGAGTFEAAVLCRSGDAFVVRAASGADDLGAVALDALIGERRDGWTLLDQDWLPSRDQATPIHRWSGTVPPAGGDGSLSRDEFEAIAVPVLGRTVALTRTAVDAAGVGGSALAGVFLTGAVSGLPLVSTLLRDDLGAAPVVLRQPRFAAVEGATRIAGEPVAASEPVLLQYGSLYHCGYPSGVLRSNWYVSTSSPAELLRWYGGRLDDHVEESPGVWVRRQTSNGTHEVHGITVVDADDPAFAGYGSPTAIPDHYRTLVREDESSSPVATRSADQ
jgi:molecular chaperone DnaK (HSP70)